ncbi:MAG: biotin/lipoyl-binding protein, partial [Verrucomicrobiota bacterium]
MTVHFRPLFILLFVLVCHLSLLTAQENNSGYFKLLGFLEAYEKVNMNTSQNGIISAIHVKEGNLVKQGDPVIEIDHEVLKAQLEVAAENARKSEAAIEIAKANQTRARSDYDKFRILKITSELEISRAHAESMRADGELRMAKVEHKIAQLQMAEIQAQIENHIMRSPIEGIVVELNRKVAESTALPQKAGEKEAAIIKIAQLNKLRLVVNLPAKHAKDLEVGSTLAVLIVDNSSLDFDRTETGTKVDGIIEFISPEVDPSSETIRT